MVQGPGPTPPSHCISPKISKDVANCYWKSSQREPPEDRPLAGRTFGGSESQRTWLPRGMALFQPKHCLNQRIKSSLHEAGSFAGSTLQKRKLRHGEANIPASQNLDLDPGCWAQGLAFWTTGLSYWEQPDKYLSSSCVKPGDNLDHVERTLVLKSDRPG